MVLAGVVTGCVLPETRPYSGPSLTGDWVATVAYHPATGTLDPLLGMELELAQAADGAVTGTLTDASGQAHSLRGRAEELHGRSGWHGRVLLEPITLPSDSLMTSTRDRRALLVTRGRYDCALLVYERRTGTRVQWVLQRSGRTIVSCDFWPRARERPASPGG